VRRYRESPARRVYGDVLSAAPKAPLPMLSNIADERQFEEVQGCGAYLWILGTIGSSAPFIGLFGTVVGIMRAFHAMRLTGTGGFGVVAGGISEALIATALGIAVGIVSLIFYNYLRTGWSRSTPRCASGAAGCSRPSPTRGGPMALFRSHTRGHIVAEINITPLTDCLPRPADHLHDHHLGHDEAGGRAASPRRPRRRSRPRASSSP
jgi:hypothetical protein